jgi:ribosomal protein S18 acetylase RimI-like enzyme
MELFVIHHTANIAEIQELIVDETIRHQGIGKRLFQKAKEVGTDNGYMQLEVCCNQKEYPVINSISRKV